MTEEEPPFSRWVYLRCDDCRKESGCGGTKEGCDAGKGSNGFPQESEASKVDYPSVMIISPLGLQRVFQFTGAAGRAGGTGRAAVGAGGPVDSGPFICLLFI